MLYDALRGVSPDTSVSSPPEHAGHCWIVQPNFEVVVYLDRASAAQLAFIERVAARKPSSGATALYQLTRDTVYAALESGMSAFMVQETLRAASVYPLPDNVSQMLVDWAARRERLTLYRTASLVEYSDQASRDAALASGTSPGSPIGERFIVLTPPTSPAALQPGRTVDYLAAPVRCVEVTEEGEVHIRSAKADLLVQGTVAAWAEPVADNTHWRLTQSSIERAIKAGWTTEEILATLHQRTLQPVPALMQVAIRAWAGERTLPRAVAVASDMLLHIADPGVAQAIAGSTMLQPYLRGQLGPHTFLVHREAACALRQCLDKLGLQVGSDLLFQDA